MQKQRNIRPEKRESCALCFAENNWVVMTPVTLILGLVCKSKPLLLACMFTTRGYRAFQRLSWLFLVGENLVVRMNSSGVMSRDEWDVWRCKGLLGCSNLSSTGCEVRGGLEVLVPRGPCAEVSEQLIHPERILLESFLCVAFKWVQMGLRVGRCSNTEFPLKVHRVISADAMTGFLMINVASSG